MGTITKTGKCKVCEKQSRFEKQTPAHLVHFILSLVTAGAWLLVWIPVTLWKGMHGFRCVNCGSKPAFSTWLH